MAPIKRSKESKVASNNTGDRATSDEQHVSSDFGSLSWPELFTQHGHNLDKHLGICRMVKNHVLPQSDSYHVVGAMIDRTQSLLKELETLRNEFLPSNRATEILLGKNLGALNGQEPVNGSTQDAPHNQETSAEMNTQPNAFTSRGNSMPSFVFDKKPVPVSLPHHAKRNAKRAREDVSPENEGVEATSLSSSNRKRKRTKGVDKDAPEVGHAGSTSAPPVGVEDISEEVEARLKIKEEKRKKKEGKKRKRESTASAAQATSAENPNDQPPKRPKTDAISGGEQDVAAASKPREKKKTKRRAIDDASTEGNRDDERGNEGKKSKKLKK